MQNAGQTLLLAVTGFGYLATIVFGLSTSLVLSVAMLLLLGALDNISVVISGTLLLTQSPDEIRGRIASVNSIFIGVSNELGSFKIRAGSHGFGPVIAVVAGGIGTIIVVLVVAKVWPEIGQLKTLSPAFHEPA